MLLIKQCTLRGAWYEGMEGTKVRHVPRPDWEADGFYCAIETAGYKNIVKMEDAEVVNG